MLTASSRIFAGTPSAIAPEGTIMPLGMRAWAPTRAPDLMRGFVEDDRARADQTVVLNGATLKVNVVSNRAAVADHGVEG